MIKQRAEIIARIGVVAMAGAFVLVGAAESQSARVESAQESEVAFALPQLSKSDPIDISFPDPRPVGKVYEALEKAFDIKIDFANGLTMDAPIELEAENLSVYEALEQVTSQVGHFFVVQSTDRVLVAPDTPQNRRKYERLVMATFRLDNVSGEAAMNHLRALLDVRKVGLDQRLRTVTLRDTVAKVAAAQRLLQDLDRAASSIAVDLKLINLPRETSALTFGRGVNTNRLQSAVSDAGGETVFSTTVTMASGSSQEVRAGERRLVSAGGEGVIQPISEGLTVRVQATAHASTGAVTLELDLETVCGVERNQDEYARQLTRSLSSHARLNVDESLLVNEVLPAGQTGHCGLGKAAEGAIGDIVLQMTPVVIEPEQHELEMTVWPVGTESNIEVAPMVRTTGTPE